MDCRIRLQSLPPSNRVNFFCAWSCEPVHGRVVSVMAPKVIPELDSCERGQEKKIWPKCTMHAGQNKTKLNIEEGTGAKNLFRYTSVRWERVLLLPRIFNPRDGSVASSRTASPWRWVVHE